MDGLLWPQVLGTPTGAPQHAEVHPLLQPIAMEGLLCQIGMGPATRSKKGVLWLLPRPQGTEEDPAHDWEMSVPTLEPPVCLAHARKAVEWCVELRRGHEAVWIREAELVGAAGIYYPPDQARPVERVLPLDSPDISFMVATGLVRLLQVATPVDLFDPRLAGTAVPCNA